MKRRKLKDNPYTIKYHKINNKYTISFIMNSKKKEIEVSKEIYDTFNKFELEDKSYMNKYVRHIEHSTLTENSLNVRMINKQTITEDIVIKNIKNKELYSAINKLPKIQKERITKFYFYNISKKEMALKDNCSIRAIQYSIDVGLKNSKKYLS